MERERVAELHFITHYENLESILNYGILSHLRAGRAPHRSVASRQVQKIRRSTRLPNGRMLHTYANLYFDARNPMMFRLLWDGVNGLIVIRVSADILDVPGTILADGNAASGGTRFYESPAGLANLDEELVFAESWNDSDEWQKRIKKRIRCAEVLVPHLVPKGYIKGCYTRTRQIRDRCLSLSGDVLVEINRKLYFDE
jgi:ssDNA thymidine ADP-ribosyltransferase, DarT